MIVNLCLLESVISIALENGANSIRSVTFSVTDLRAYRTEALLRALKAARENLATFEAENANELKALTPESSAMLAGTRAGLSAIQGPTDPSGQKKAGNCKLPQGICFIKASFALVQQI